MFGGGIGMQEILIILVVGLLVFGAARLPKIARSLGLGIKEFKKTVKGINEEDDEGNKIKYVQNQPPINQQNPPYNPNTQQPGPGQYNNPNQQNQQNMGEGYSPGAGQPPYGSGNAQNPAPEQGQPPKSDDDKQGT